jgi:alcohol dehydrogenase
MSDSATLLRILKRVSSPAQVVSGPGSLRYLQCLEGERLFVLSTGSAEHYGTLQAVAKLLDKSGAQWQCCQAKSGTPRSGEIACVTQKLNSFQPSSIISIGGGSVIDLAKIAWAAFVYPDIKFQDEKILNIPVLRKRARLIAVPTTTGSGSEASQVAVLQDDSGRVRPFVSDEWVPDVVILDPALTESLPRDVAISTAFDALAHAVESYVSRIAFGMTRVHAAGAVRLITKNLVPAISRPSNAKAREALLNAAYLAGLSQSAASTGAAHAFAHSATHLFGWTHAAAVASFLLPTMVINLRTNPGLYDALAVDAGFSDSENLIEVFRALQTEVGFQSLRIAGEQGPLERLADCALADVCMKTNPVQHSRESMIDFLRLSA